MPVFLFALHDFSSQASPIDGANFHETMAVSKTDGVNCFVERHFFMEPISQFTQVSLIKCRERYEDGDSAVLRLLTQVAFVERVHS